MKYRRCCITTAIAGILFFSLVNATTAQEAKKKPLQEITIANGKFKLKVPGAWKKKQPRVRIIQYEFQIPAVAGDKRPGRMTIMAAGGSIKANIDRWVGQFDQGKAPENRPKIEKKKVAGQTVHILDISGTFLERRGPFAPPTRREGYRMLGAIVETKNSGNQFIKLTAPKNTAATAEKAFHQMIEGIEPSK